MIPIAEAIAMRLAATCAKCAGPIGRVYARDKLGGYLCCACHVSKPPALIKVATRAALPPCTYPGCTAIPFQKYEAGRCGLHVINRLEDET